jgi:hypothetical protein
MTRALVRAVLVASALLLAACEDPVDHATASGRPEVTVATRDTEMVKATLVNEMLDGGFTLLSDSAHQLVFEQPAGDLMSWLLYAEDVDDTPNARIAYTIAPSPAGVRVVGDLAMISRPGTPAERRTSLNNSRASAELQQALFRLKQAIERG